MSAKNPWEDEGWKGNSNNFQFDIIDKIKKQFFGNFGNNNENNKFSYCAVLLVFGAIYLFSGFYQVQPDERGVVMRFGRWVRTVGPGLQYIIPAPFEAVIVRKVTTVNQIDIGAYFKGGHEESLMLTGDSNLANISFSVLWKIKENGVEDYLFNAKSPEVTVRAVAESVMREIVGQTPFTYVQTDGRAETQAKALKNLQIIMNDYKMGIEIIRVELQRVEPPFSVVDSFRDVERAQAEQQSEKNKAEAYERDTTARTRGLVAEIINTGEAKKQQIIQTAKGAVARFLSAYSQYKLAPDVVAKRLYIETMRDVYKNINKIIIDSDVKSVPYLPITELNRSMRENRSEFENQIEKNEVSK